VAYEIEGKSDLAALNGKRIGVPIPCE